MPIYRKYVKKYARKQPAKKKTSYASRDRNLVKLIKSVSLKQSETKMATTDSTALSVLHNVSLRVRENLFSTGQGITDGLSVNNRIGDTVIPIGVKLYMTFRQPADRPNVTFKVWILKTYGNVLPPVFVPVKGITGNLMMDPIDTEKATIVKVITVKAPDNYFNGTVGNSKEMTFFRKLWIPCARTPYVYGQDGGPLGKKWQMAMYVTAYDTFGSLITDIIGGFACSQSFYFKDS